METIKIARQARFKFEKLYLDCIDEYGNCFINYRAEIKFLFMRFHYSAFIFSDPAGHTIERSTHKKTMEPVIKDLIIFYNHSLHLKGSWRRSAPAMPPMTLAGDLVHNLKWNCHHPSAISEIMYNNNTYNGNGYAETLSFTMNPAGFPFDELRWGRFLSEKYVIIWLNWRGSQPMNKIFINGAEYADAVIEEDNIIFGNGTFSLAFEKKTTIRKGKLSDTLSKYPWLKIIPGSSYLNSMENKYKAKATLTINSETAVSGWSLYETLIWKK
jgi:hypothetical protein